MEHWVEINLDAEVSVQDGILLDSLLPHVRRLERRGELVTYHFFREPEIRFRVRLRTASAKKREARDIARLADSLVGRGQVSEWRFGNHGEAGIEYVGEEDRYGKRGWQVAQDYFRKGADTALWLLDLKRKGRLENLLWGKGLGNPWEGGGRNPWREKEEDPLAFHWSRAVHLFSNQLGFDMLKEAELCTKQSERYRRVAAEIGMKW